MHWPFQKHVRNQGHSVFFEWPSIQKKTQDISNVNLFAVVLKNWFGSFKPVLFLPRLHVGKCARKMTTLGWESTQPATWSMVDPSNQRFMMTQSSYMKIASKITNYKGDFSWVLVERGLFFASKIRSFFCQKNISRMCVFCVCLLLFLKTSVFSHQKKERKSSKWYSNDALT